MPYKLKLSSLLALVSVLITGISWTSILAQDDMAQEIEEVIVTGSRIVRLELEGSSAVQVFDRVDITRSGQTSLGELLREIPSVAGGAQTTQVNNGGDGTNRISLRGIGSERTLVLMNGRRLPSSSTGLSSTNLGGVVDLNTIPVSMVERIEIFKDGASAIYGADAVGGVVNILTRRDFEGIDINYQWGQTSLNDGDKSSLDFTMGSSSDTASYLAFAGYVEEGAICACDRDWAATPLASLNGELIASGSSAPPWGNYATSNGRLTRGPEYGDFIPFDFFGGGAYNFAPSNHQRQPSRRWSIAFQADRILEDLSILGETRLFFDMSYLNRDSNQRLAEVPLAPLAFFGYDAPYTADNYFNPFNEEIGDWRRRMVEDGSRFEDVITETKRFMVGLEGEIEGWDWDTYFGFGETASEGHFGNVYNLEKVANAVGPSLKDADGNFVLDSDGNPMCANDTDNCVVLDVFGQGSVTQEMVDYLTFVDNQSSLQDQKVLAFNLVNSNILDLAGGPMGVAAGFEWREERGADVPDSQVNALGGAATGTPRKPTSGGYVVSEVYGELVLPVIASRPGVELLELNLASRYSDYDTFGTTTNSKVSFKYRPVESVLTRASFSQAFRAPSTSDLFGGSGFSFPFLIDPCATDPTQFCVADGVPAGGFTPISSQIRSTVGGNPVAEPETADIISWGVVYEPEWMAGLSVTVDHFDIQLTNALSVLGGGYILDACHSRGQHCDLIARVASGANAGNPINVLNVITNVGGINTAGFDIGAYYRGFETPYGELDLRFEATNLRNFEVIQADGTVIDLTGRYSDDQGGYYTEWRANLDVVLINETWDVGWQVRQINKVEETYVDWALGEQDRTIKGRTYHDLVLNWSFPDYQVQLTGGIDNVLDEEPPLSLSAFNDNTDVRTFDTAGRYMYFRVNFKR